MYAYLMTQQEHVNTPETPKNGGQQPSYVDSALLPSQKYDYKNHPG